MTDRRLLLLLRHAEAEATRSGRHDLDRRLTEAGRAHAEAVGSIIRSEGWQVDHVTCSPASRTRQTLSHLDLPPTAVVDFADSLYSAGTDTIIESIRLLPNTVRTAMVLGHAPGIPGVLYDLVDPHTADPVAWARVEPGFPPGTLAALELSTTWDELAVISPIAVHTTHA